MIRHFFILLLLGMVSVAWTQTVPQGMNYQAVARNGRGEPASNQRIQLKIHLFSNTDQHRFDHFIENHIVTTQANGVFSLVIGEGIQEFGDFTQIPWNTENIWMEVSMKDKNATEFSSVTKSKLLAVPYAIHAATATQLNPINGLQPSAPPEPGVISNTWSVFGNANTDSSGNVYHTNALGTTDKVDLFLITDNVERLRILNGGNIVTKLNFNVAQNLKVGGNFNGVMSTYVGDSMIAKKNVFLNTSSGSTIIYGPFTVLNGSATLLSGKLTVDKPALFNAGLNVDGPTDINDSLFVNNKSKTKFTGTLTVDSITTLNDTVYVNNRAATVLTGTLVVDSCSTFNDKLKILSTYVTDTSGLVSGSLQVAGGAYISKNLYVGGLAKFDGPVAFLGPVAIRDLTQSTSPTTGALRVSGGVGIGLNLNVGGAAMINNMLSILDSTASSDINTGALKVMGGFGLKKELNVRSASSFNNTLWVAGATTFNNYLRVSSGEPFVASFINTSNNNGISIQVNNPVPDGSNTYVSFRKNDGGQVGRIEGENATGSVNNKVYKKEIDRLQGLINNAQLNFVVATASLIAASVQLVGAINSATACISAGALACLPVSSLIAKRALDVVSGTIGIVTAGHAVDIAIARKEDYVNYKAARVGVTYESGAADYAEWLPKSDTSESFLPGYIVGLKGGRITKQTSQGGRLFVISTQPIVLGNMPNSAEENRFERVAFLGQVPVHVLGQVHIGDFILPSGKNDGVGRAVAPDNMKIEDFGQVVGTAWSASTNEVYNLINVAIGLNTSDINKIIIQQNKRIQDLSDKINKRSEILAQLVPGYRYTPTYTTNTISPSTTSGARNHQLKELKALGSSILGSGFTVSKDQLENLFTRAEQMIVEKGGSVHGSPFWDKYKYDTVFKDQILNRIQDQVKKITPEQIEQLKKQVHGK